MEALVIHPLRHLLESIIPANVIPAAIAGKRLPMRTTISHPTKQDFRE